MDNKAERQETEIEASGDAIIIADAIACLADAISALARATRYSADAMNDMPEAEQHTDTYLDGTKRDHA